MGNSSGEDEDLGTAKSSRRVPDRRRRGIVAWLVTWEAAGRHVTPPRRIAAVFNRRWSGERVREQVELIHVQWRCAIAEQITYANDRSFNPYPATFTVIS